jgi:hypothetical protein
MFSANVRVASKKNTRVYGGYLDWHLMHLSIDVEHQVASQSATDRKVGQISSFLRNVNLHAIIIRRRSACRSTAVSTPSLVPSRGPIGRSVSQSVVRPTYCHAASRLQYVVQIYAVLRESAECRAERTVVTSSLLSLLLSPADERFETLAYGSRPPSPRAERHSPTYARTRAPMPRRTSAGRVTQLTLFAPSKCMPCISSYTPIQPGKQTGVQPGTAADGQNAAFDLEPPTVTSVCPLCRSVYIGRMHLGKWTEITRRIYTSP